MALYEVTNGWTGESYVRVYVWAASEERARELALEAFRKDKPEQAKIESVRKLFASTDAEFSSRPSDGGFNDDGM